MSNYTKSLSIAAGIFCAAALMISASATTAQRPSSGQSEAQRPPPPEQPPPPTRPPPQTTPPTRPPPQTTPPDTRPPAPPPAPTREENARAEQQREANARAQQQKDLERAEKVRQDQEARDQARLARLRQEQEAKDQARLAKQRQEQAAAADPKHRDVIGQLISAERVHREQLARINRLKQIAQRQGQAERIGELDRLLVESNTNFQHKLDAAKPELPEPQFTETVKMLEQGRRREVRQMMGQDAGPVKVERAPNNGGGQTRERAPVAERTQPVESRQPPR